MNFESGFKLSRLPKIVDRRKKIERKSVTIQTGNPNDDDSSFHINYHITENYDTTNEIKRKIVFNKSADINNCYDDSSMFTRNDLNSSKHNLNSNYITLKQTTYIRSNKSNIPSTKENISKNLNTNTSSQNPLQNTAPTESDNKIIDNKPLKKIPKKESIKIKTNFEEIYDEKNKIILIDGLSKNNYNSKEIKNSPLRDQKPKSLEKKTFDFSKEDPIRPKTPIEVTQEMGIIFDKMLGRVLNIYESPHKKKMDSFNINKKELEHFIKEHTKEKEKKEEIAKEKKFLNENLSENDRLRFKLNKEFMEYQKDNPTIKNNDYTFVGNILDNIKKKIFYIKNVVDYLYPKVVINNVKSYTQSVKNSKNKNINNNIMKLFNVNNNNENTSASNNENQIISLPNINTNVSYKKDKLIKNNEYPSTDINVSKSSNLTENRYNKKDKLTKNNEHMSTDINTNLGYKKEKLENNEYPSTDNNTNISYKKEKLIKNNEYPLLDNNSNVNNKKNRLIKNNEYPSIDINVSKSSNLTASKNINKINDFNDMIKINQKYYKKRKHSVWYSLCICCQTIKLFLMNINHKTN